MLPLRVSNNGVTGSTGQLGGRVTARLSTLGQPQCFLARDLERAPQLSSTQAIQLSYEDWPSMRATLSGIQALFLVSGYGPICLEQHYSALDVPSLPSSATPSTRSPVTLPGPWPTTSTSIRRANSTSQQPHLDPIQGEVD